MSMLIRLSLFDEDIAYRFRVHPSTVSRNFHRVLDVAAAKAAAMIKWPEREVLRQTMPRNFFKKCYVIMTVLKYSLNVQLIC